MTLYILRPPPVSFQDSTASLALDPDDSYSILTKPHGHGDVHALMHSSGTAKSWKEAGCEWVVFMQVRFVAVPLLSTYVARSSSFYIGFHVRMVPSSF